ncbi:winged helix-turn-helix transcriptional regulator [Amycolatopsis sp. NPDC059657]|uniref:winged helix-turn-helix transcriptional regulator n=1 Tax=Amycolatopsis sp. NPDC059657 TaxID=3346899 RepID=UPI00366B5EC1
MDTVRHLQPDKSWVDSYLDDCPARTVLDVLANKWTLLVVSALRQHGGPMRFNELRRRLTGITQKMLTQTLRALERDGLAARKVYPTVPPRVEYTLTALGIDAGKLLNAIGEWSEHHVPEILDSRATFDARPDPS